MIAVHTPVLGSSLFGREVRSGINRQDSFFLGTFAPDFRASLRPIAIASLRLVTFFPLPDLRVPDFFSFITLWTLSCALVDFFAMIFLSREFAVHFDFQNRATQSPVASL